MAPLELLDDAEACLADKAVNIWEYHFNDKPHDDAILLDRLPAATEAATEAVQEWDDPSSS
jgi:hypothetical protein